jgi:nucleoside-diphosphate-sugar epimerase
MARYFLTGVAGFIAARVAEFLLDSGNTVIGVDNMNDAYDVRMKDYRLGKLIDRQGFSFWKVDVSDRDDLWRVFQTEFGQNGDVHCDAIITKPSSVRTETSIVMR